MPTIKYRSDKTNAEINAEIARHLGVDPVIDYAGDLNEAIKLLAINQANVNQVERPILAPSGANWQATYYTDMPVNGDFDGIDKYPSRAICLAWLAWRDKYQIKLHGR